MMRAVLLALFLATPGLTSPGLAEPVPGTDDPAFRAPFDRALQGDDPTALLELHAAAEAGNVAALLALPAASDWLRAGMSPIALSWPSFTGSLMAWSKAINMASLPPNSPTPDLRYMVESLPVRLFSSCRAKMPFMVSAFGLAMMRSRRSEAAVSPIRAAKSRACLRPV